MSIIFDGLLDDFEVWTSGTCFGPNFITDFNSVISWSVECIFSIKLLYSCRKLASRRVVSEIQGVGYKKVFQINRFCRTLTRFLFFQTYI